jgi:Cu-Zn family superoxide dismutase
MRRTVAGPIAVLIAVVIAALPATAIAEPPRLVAVSGQFGDGTAVTYRPELVPAGARVTVLGLPMADSTTVVLSVRGLVPGRHYGAHVHTKPCGPAPTDSGPHYQDQVDPVQPSTDPAYANPYNEIWLDFATGEQGAAFTSSTVDWTFGERRGASVVIHETHTHTAPGTAGTAGARLACVSVAF